MFSCAVQKHVNVNLRVVLSSNRLKTAQWYAAVTVGSTQKFEYTDNIDLGKATSDGSF